MGEVTKIDYQPNPVSALFHLDRSSTVKVLCGPVGTGKSTTALWDFVLLCMESTVPLRGVVIRESYRALMDSTLATAQEWLAPVSKYRGGDTNILDITIPGFDGVTRTHELMFRSCRKSEEASKFLSTEFAFIWLEECAPAFSSARVMGAGIPSGVFEIALMRLRQRNAPRLVIVCTMNPPSTRHWTYEKFLNRKPEDLARLQWAVFRQNKEENRANLRADYYESLTEALSPEMARRFVEGQVAASFDGMPVYGEFIERLHGHAGLAPIPGLPLVFGYDFGLTPCVLIGQVSPLGQTRLYREIQLINAGIERLLDHQDELIKQDFTDWWMRAQGEEKPWRAWADPAGSKRSEVNEVTPFEVMHKRGYRAQGGAIDLFTRTNAVKQRFSRMVAGQPGVLIDSEGCPLLFEAMLGGYRYPRSVDGRTGSQPIKNEYSHLANALEYLVTGEFSMLTGGVKKVEQRKPLRADPLASGNKKFKTSWMAN